MPSVQVISRTPDPTAELISSFGNDLANTINQKKQLKIESAKLAAQAKMSEDEAKKAEFLRKKDFIDHALKFKELGITDLKPLQEIYGDDTIPFAQHLGSVLKASPGSAQDQKAMSDVRMNDMITGDPGASGSDATGSGDMASRISALQSKLPVGVTAHAGAFDIQNKALTEPESIGIAGRKQAIARIQNLIAMVDKGYVDDAGSKIRVDVGNPYATQGNNNLQMYQSGLNALKGIIPFVRGGKQLTKTEATRVDRLLNTQGKSRDIIKQDMNSFANEFLDVNQSLLGGTSAANKANTLQQGQPPGNDLQSLSDEELDNLIKQQGGGL